MSDSTRPLGIGTFIVGICVLFVLAGCGASSPKNNVPKNNVAQENGSQESQGPDLSRCIELWNADNDYKSQTGQTGSTIRDAHVAWVGESTDGTCVVVPVIKNSTPSWNVLVSAPRCQQCGLFPGLAFVHDFNYLPPSNLFGDVDPAAIGLVEKPMRDGTIGK